MYFRSRAEYTALGVLRNTNPQFFSADFLSCLVARSRKSIKCVLKTLLRRFTHAVPIRSQKANDSPAASKSDDLVDASMTGYPIHIDQDYPKCLGEDHISYCKTVRGSDILRNVISSGHFPFYQINRFFVNKLFFSSLPKCIAAGWNGFAGRI